MPTFRFSSNSDEKRNEPGFVESAQPEQLHLRDQAETEADVLPISLETASAETNVPRD